MKIKAYTKVANEGWTALAFDIAHPKGDISPSDFAISIEERGAVRENASRVTDVTATAEGIHINVEPFAFRKFRITGSGAASGISFCRDDVSEVKTEWADLFEARYEIGVHYRLYSPESYGPRPLVLFLHGGGECGSDNWAQMVGTLGAARIAEDYPDVYVMAPQAPRGLMIQPDGRPKMPRTFAESDIRGETGWHRRYLASICDIIRGMVSEGKVDPERIYVTGLSMGGAGTIRALSVGSDLFAAAVPICPTMTPETYGILCGLVHMKIWIASAYVDHTIYRHKYLVDGIMKLKDYGNKNARLTLYSPEDLEKYGIATDPDMPLDQRFSANHASWILVYNNEEGIMDWLMSQKKQ